jgi:hypothetical protein
MLCTWEISVPFIDAQTGYPCPFIDAQAEYLGPFIVAQAEYPGPFIIAEAEYPGPFIDAQAEYPDLLTFYKIVLNLSMWIPTFTNRILKRTRSDQICIPQV